MIIKTVPPHKEEMEATAPAAAAAAVALTTTATNHHHLHLHHRHHSTTAGVVAADTAAARTAITPVQLQLQLQLQPQLHPQQQQQQGAEDSPKGSSSGILAKELDKGLWLPPPPPPPHAIITPLPTRHEEEQEQESMKEDTRMTTTATTTTTTTTTSTTTTMAVNTTWVVDAATTVGTAPETNNNNETNSVAAAIIASRTDENNSSGGYRIGTKLIKYFPGLGTFGGTVVSVSSSSSLPKFDDEDEAVDHNKEAPQEDNGGNIDKEQESLSSSSSSSSSLPMLLYGIEYEDGDYEDLDENELNTALSSDQDGKAKGDSKTQENNTAITDDCNDASRRRPRQSARIQKKHKHACGTEIIKHFHGTGWVKGQVQNLVLRQETRYYSLEYDNGETEELSEPDLDDYLANYTENLEQWQTCRKHAVGTEIIKYFQDYGWFRGHVQSHHIPISGEDTGVVCYHIQYEDGDAEDVSEQELDELVAQFDSNLCAWEKEHGVVTVQKKTKRKRPVAASPQVVFHEQEATWSKRQRRMGGKERGNKASRKSLSYCISRMKHKSLYKLLPKSPTKDEVTADATVTREMVLEMVDINPPLSDKLMIPKDLHKCIPEMLEFHLLALERQRIFLGQETQQEILRHAHICNNYRELDRGTGFLRSQILELKDYVMKNNIPFTRLNWTEQVLALIYHYRLSNRAEIFLCNENPLKGRIPRQGEFGAFESFVWDCQRSKRIFFTQAHQTIGFNEYVSHCKGITMLHGEKINGENVTKLRYLATQIVNAGSDLKKVCGVLNNMKGIGTFQCWQLACDLQEAQCLLEGEDSFCVFGPGAKNGLMNVFGAEINGKYTFLELTTFLRDSMDYCMRLFNLEFPLWKGQPLTLKVMEHVLCEFNKFKRLESGQDVGLRKRQSFAHLDPTTCRWCKVIPLESDSTRCDSCRRLACSKCKCTRFVFTREAGDQSNSCCGCHEFENNLTFIDC